MLQCILLGPTSKLRFDVAGPKPGVSTLLGAEGIAYPARVRRYWAIAVTMILAFGALFAVVEALGVRLLTDPSPWLEEGGAVAACVGVGLLLVDVLLPVPSSLVMVAHGSLFGVLLGTLLSLAGSVGAAAFAFWLGRRGGGWVHRLVGEERERADALLSRWGAVAIVATRPLPLLAETVAILAGTSAMGWRPLLLGALAGSLPPALLYALTGATAASLDESWMVLGLVLLMTGIFWLWARRITQ